MRLASSRARRVLLAPVLIGAGMAALAWHASAQQPIDTGSADRVALAQGRMGRWADAATQWTSFAEMQPLPDGGRVAARAYVLATIAWERASDGRAYEAWTRGIKLYLESGTSWEMERAQLHHLVERLDEGLRQAQGGAGRVVTVGAADLLLLDLERELGFTTFQGPRPGLAGDATGTIAPSPLAPAGAQANTLSATPSVRAAPEGASSVQSRAMIRADEVAADAIEGAAWPDAAFGLSPAAALENARAGSSTRGGTRAVIGTEAETIRALASVAWRYVRANLRTHTGMVDAVAGYSRATLWDVASSLAAIACAERLALIDRGELARLATPMLARLASLPLYNDELPNREYDLNALTMTDAGGQGSASGSGWSAIDLGRLLIWLHIVKTWYPELAPQVDAVVQRWRFDRLVREGQLHGTLREGERETLRQEGRLGYEQYAAAGVALWGHVARRAITPIAVRQRTLYGIAVPYDSRSHAFLTSEPFVLAAIELGPLGPEFDRASGAVYRVQQARWKATGVLTAMSEDALAREPWFAYNAIIANGLPWACVTPGGRRLPDLRSLSTKAAVAWWAIAGDAYSERLLAAVRPLAAPQGFHAGRFEAGETNTSLNINTNAVILEAALFRLRGRRPFVEIGATGATSTSTSTSAPGPASRGSRHE